MIIVSSLEAAQDAFRQFNPVRVISLLSEDETVPEFTGFTESAHLKLYVEHESCATAMSNAASKRANDIVAFAKNWDGQGDILVHCKRGVSRSIAAAFIIMCAKRPDEDETSLIEELRRLAPHSDPCPLLINYADELLDRDGRMLDAVEELGPPCTVIAAPIAKIPLAA